MMCACRVAFAVMMLAAVIALVPPARAQSIDEKARTCAACHGENGVPLQKVFPVIWGQQLGYLYLQLRDFKSGARKNDIMSPIVSTLERDDMMALAQYFSKKPWPHLQQPPTSAAAAKQAVQANDSIGCTVCHQDGYKGEGTQPRLSGQTKEYLLKSMIDFRTGARGNNPGMSDLMKATPKDALEPLAEYLAGL